MSERHVWIGRISLYGILISATFPKAVGITAGIMARIAGRDIWAAECLAIGFALLFVAGAALISRRLGAPPLTAMQRVLPRWGVSLFALVEAFFFCLLYVGGVYTFLGHTQYFFLTETPLIIFLLAIAILALVGAAYGLEVLARTAVVGAVGHMGVTALMTPGVIWDLTFVNLWPLAARGWTTFYHAGLVGLADLVQPIPFVMALLPITGNTRGHIRHSILAMLTAGLMIVIWPLAEILVLGPELTSEQAVACLGVARAASLGIYLHRYELLMLLFFMPGVFLVEVLPFLAASRSLAQAVGIANHRRLFLPLVGVLTAFSQWLFSSRFRSDSFFSSVWPWLILVLVGVQIAAALLTVVLLARGPRRRASAPGPSGRTGATDPPPSR